MYIIGFCFSGQIGRSENIFGEVIAQLRPKRSPCNDLNSQKSFCCCFFMYFSGTDKNVSHEWCLLMCCTFQWVVAMRTDHHYSRL